MAANEMKKATWLRWADDDDEASTAHGLGDAVKVPQADFVHIVAILYI